MSHTIVFKVYKSIHFLCNYIVKKKIPCKLFTVRTLRCAMLVQCMSIQYPLKYTRSISFCPISNEVKGLRDKKKQVIIAVMNRSKRIVYFYY